MSDPKPTFDVSMNEMNFQVGTPPSNNSKAQSTADKTAPSTDTTNSSATKTASSAMSSLRAKLSAAAQEYRPASTVADVAPSTDSAPAKTQKSSSQANNSKAGSRQAPQNEEFDPNQFEPLSGSGDYPIDDVDADFDPSMPNYTDSESFGVESDDDHTRDLCSNPCIQCNKVPSYVVYELCIDCLDKMGPQ
jgi:hypothetical protein